jgi:hypothetical protein
VGLTGARAGRATPPALLDVPCSFVHFYTFTAGSDDGETP